jgi:hypothetical protein
MMTMTGERCPLRGGWFVLLVLLLLLGCAPTPASTPTATPVPPAETAVAPTPTALPTETAPPTETPTPIPPTATFTPSPEPTPPEEALVPRGAITPPPPNFQPTAPPPPDIGSGSEEAWVRDYVGLVTAMLNSGKGVEPVLETLRTWSKAPAGGESELASYVWAETVDLDEDGEDEWLMSLPVPERGCGVTWCPAYVVIYEYLEEKELFRPTYVVSSEPPQEVQMQHPELRRVGDLNADERSEVLIEQRWCGAHTCFTGLTVGRYDGATWHDLAAGPINQAYTELSIEDRDGDGAVEFTMHGGMIGSVGAGLQRPYTQVYDWVDGAYRLVEETPDPSDHPYYLMLDANVALAEGNWERALELATQAVNRPDFEDSMAPVEEVDKRRIVSYAAVEAMLVHAQRGDGAMMEAVLEQARSHDHVEPNVYTEAAERLMGVYGETGDVVEACAAMEEVVAQRPDEAVFFQWYGYNTARMTVDQVCPLDAPVEGESPQL